MTQDGTMQIVQALAGLTAKIDEQDKTTLRWRDKKDKEDLDLAKRVAALEVTAARGSGALAMFLKTGTVFGILAGALAFARSFFTSTGT